MIILVFLIKFTLNLCLMLILSVFIPTLPNKVNKLVKFAGDTKHWSEIMHQ